MARIPRILIENKHQGESTVYHVMSRTALDGFPMKDEEKDYLLTLFKHYSNLYLVEVLGFCCMDNHFHLLIRMHSETNYTDEEIKARYEQFHKQTGTNRELMLDEIPALRCKLSSLSEYAREIKLNFTRFYNKRHHRKGFFWGGRFKSTVVEDGETLINCLAYIDLNPVRAGIVEKPEDYRWNSIGYHLQTDNKDDFLSLDFGLKAFGMTDADDRLKEYRRFLYETGAMTKNRAEAIRKEVLEKERQKGFKVSRADRFALRTRHFCDSGIIGSKAFVKKQYDQVKHLLKSKNEKTPKLIEGLDGVYSLKRLAGHGFGVDSGSGQTN